MVGFYGVNLRSLLCVLLYEMGGLVSSAGLRPGLTRDGMVTGMVYSGVRGTNWVIGSWFGLVGLDLILIGLVIVLRQAGSHLLLGVEVYQIKLSLVWCPKLIKR